jgi:Flp pilus assembly pilin Flp
VVRIHSPRSTLRSPQLLTERALLLATSFRLADMDKMIHTIAISSFHLSRWAWAHKASMISRTLRAHWQAEDAQDMVEYALLLGFVALAAVSLLSGVRDTISNIWSQIGNGLSTGAS